MATLALAGGKPNILIIYIDDMGWGQPGVYGGTLAPTPNMDRIADNGVRFTDAYVSSPICSPSRVGLLTGRYQARSGHDSNTEGKNEPAKSLVLSEKLFPQYMKEAGYTTGIVGKWHVGASDPFLPAARGFDYAYGSVGNLGFDAPFFEGRETLPQPDESPITSPLFAEEACAFMEAHRNEPWFLYLSFNAVHSPHTASPEYLERFRDLRPKWKRPYAALVAEMDDAIGTVMEKLDELGLEKNTLVFCLSDNGGAASAAEQGGLRGEKWFVWEGGIRVSFMAQWPGRIPAGKVISEPVIQLDILPTALAAADAQPDPNIPLDGINLLPLLEGSADHLAPRELFWRFGVQYAVRKENWKLVKAGLDEPVMLVDLETDLGETTDLSTAHPEKAAELQSLWDTWNATMQPPRWEDPRWNHGPNKKKWKENK